MRTDPEQSVAVLPMAPRVSARWAATAPGPSFGGLMVAAAVGLTAAGGWTLSTWIALGKGAAPTRVTAPSDAMDPAGPERVVWLP